MQIFLKGALTSTGPQSKQFKKLTEKYFKQHQRIFDWISFYGAQNCPT